MSFSDFPHGERGLPAARRRSATTSIATSTTSGFATRSPSTPGSSTSSRSTAAFEVDDHGRAPGREETQRYDAVLVCNGHHWDPRWPEPAFPGSFAGVEMHAHDYRRPEQLEGKRVIVVGGGNSGMDIARDAADHAEPTYLSLRRGVHVIRKRLGRQAQPIDQTLRRRGCRGRSSRRGSRCCAGARASITEYGFPEPDHKVGHAHPTVSDKIHDRLAAGAVIAKPNIRELRGDRVEFEDGSEVEADLIVYCTGYRVSFPFFDPGFVSAPDNDLPLYRPHVPSRDRGRLLPRARAATRRDHADGRAAVEVDRGAASRRVRAAARRARCARTSPERARRTRSASTDRSATRWRSTSTNGCATRSRR